MDTFVAETYYSTYAFFAACIATTYVLSKMRGEGLTEKLLMGIVTFVGVFIAAVMAMPTVVPIMIAGGIR